MESKSQGEEKRSYTPEETSVLKKVGAEFTRAELAVLERLLNDKTTKLTASIGEGSAAYHR